MRLSAAFRAAVVVITAVATSVVAVGLTSSSTAVASPSPVHHGSVWPQRNEHGSVRLKDDVSALVRHGGSGSGRATYQGAHDVTAPISLNFVLPLRHAGDVQACSESTTYEFGRRRARARIPFRSNRGIKRCNATPV